jgi:anti-sigma B factor antagonist
VGSGADVGLSLSIERDDRTAVVTIGGELGYDTAAQLRSALLQLSQEEAGVLVLDMSAVEFLDSTGISLLVQAKQRFDAEGAAFVLRHPPARVTRVLEVAGLADLFAIETGRDT